jgi:hypothetical protein
MDLYNLSAVSPTNEVPRDRLLFTFLIIGVDGRPVVGLSFETQAEAEAAREVMRSVVAKAKLITPHTG